MLTGPMVKVLLGHEIVHKVFYLRLSDLRNSHKQYCSIHPSGIPLAFFLFTALSQDFILPITNYKKLCRVSIGLNPLSEATDLLMC